MCLQGSVSEPGQQSCSSIKFPLRSLGSAVGAAGPQDSSPGAGFGQSSPHYRHHSARNCVIILLCVAGLSYLARRPKSRAPERFPKLVAGSFSKAQAVQQHIQRTLRPSPPKRLGALEKLVPFRQFVLGSAPLMYTVGPPVSSLGVRPAEIDKLSSQPGSGFARSQCRQQASDINHFNNLGWPSAQRCACKVL